MTSTVFGGACFWAAALGREIADGALGLGATSLNAIDNGSRWTTMADPEGNEFDLIAG